MDRSTSWSLEKLETLSDKVLQGLLYLCLLEEPLDLLHLSEFLGTHEVVDQILALPFLIADQNSICLDRDKKPTVLSHFKWSEKVKASDTLAHFFEGKAFSPENRGDLWLMAGDREKACKAYQEAMVINKADQQYPSIIRCCEKVLKIGALSEEEEVELLKLLINCYDCCGELHGTIQYRSKLLAKPAIQGNKEVYAAQF